jgi:hypothetical protein
MTCPEGLSPPDQGGAFGGVRGSVTVRREVPGGPASSPNEGLEARSTFL